MDSKWLEFIDNEKKKDYFKKIISFLDKEKDENGNDNFYPKKEEIFNAFELTSYDEVKVVIIGQDPYHEENQAHGLAFSVLNQIPPKSLINIFKELDSDCNIRRTNTNLSDWAKQGVLLINATLTVRKHEANSHKDIGWNYFTDNVIKYLNESNKKIVYILLGSFAQSKKDLIDTNKHLIIEAAHPSPLSAYRGFFGSKIFSKTNDLLIKNGEKPINW